MDVILAHQPSGVNEQTKQLYFIVDKSTLDAFRNDQDVAAIREGLADVEAAVSRPSAIRSLAFGDSLGFRGGRDEIHRR